MASGPAPSEDHVRQTMATYDAIAADYYVTATPELRRWKEDSMRRFRGWLPGQRVLVAACGDGRDSRYLAGLGLSVASFDLSAGMLEQARKADPDGSYEQRDLREIGSLTGRYDGIWAAGCLYHLTKTEFADWIERARTVLTPDGVIYFSMKEGAGERYEEAPGTNYPGGHEARAKLRGRRFYAYYAQAELRALLTRYAVLEERRPDFGERNFEFWLRRDRGLAEERA